MFRFGHFSDLHFQYKNYDTNALRDSLIETLKKTQPLNAIFITGDVFNKGKNGINEQKQVREYVKTMASAARCELDHIFIVAGNHDLQRNRARASVLNDIIKYNLEHNRMDTQLYQSMIYGDYCIPFNKFCNTITGRNDPNKEIHRFIPLDDVNLILLNTSIFAGQTDPEETNRLTRDEKKRLESVESNNLFICDDKFEKLKRTIARMNISEKPIIVLAHHGVECFEEKERARLVHFLNDIKCSIYLCGHIHRPSTHVIEGSPIYQVTCGGPFVDGYNKPSFILGEYDSMSDNLTMHLYSYLSDWKPDNQAEYPWEDGVWSKKLTMINP